jgi:Bifunctional DNA primase/polymerase, N-terminal
MLNRLNQPEESTSPSMGHDHSIRDAALEYAALGFWVVRLKERLKVADIEDWPRKGKTKDPDVIRRWFTEQPLANIGIVCGNGLVAIDIDARSNGHVNWLMFVGEHGPNGELGVNPPRVVTPGGGLHLYFRIPSGTDLRNRQNFIPGVDVRGNGGYVAAPPSVHPNGLRYAWGTNFVTAERFSISDRIPFMPEWLLNKLVTAAAETKAHPESEPSLSSLAVAPAPDGEPTVPAGEHVPAVTSDISDPNAVDSAAINEPKREAHVKPQAPVEQHADVKTFACDGDQDRTAKKAPGRPPERSTRKQARSDSRNSRNASKAKPGPPKAVHSRLDNSGAILADVIERFPVPSVGNRHSLMNRAVGSLVGRGCDDELIVDVMMNWFEHFYSLGKIASDRPTMEAELRACLRTTRANPDFSIAQSSSAMHDCAIAEFVIPQPMLDALEMPVSELARANARQTQRKRQSGPESTEIEHSPEDPILNQDSQTCNPTGDPLIQLLMVSHLCDPAYACDTGNEQQESPYHIGPNSPYHTDQCSPHHMGRESPYHTRQRSSMHRLCESDDERQFVATILAIVLYERSESANGSYASSVSLTHKQIRQHAARRFNLREPPWRSDNQINRLKQKYISRLTRTDQRAPPKRFELLREVHKGERARGSEHGTPSRYELTGVLALIELGRETASPPNEAA